jgi:16S rRNA (guanine527-N7)-methyltransferase
MIKTAKAAKLKQYADLLLEKNEHVNLTAPMLTEDFYVKHLIDSLLIVKYQPLHEGWKVLDIGTGGGLPGIPLAIIYPQVHFTLLDATQKKISAVEEFARALRLTNITALAARAEDLGQNKVHREDYDLVVSRAVAPLRELLELAMPLVHLNGRFIAYKGPDYISELTQARSAITKLQCERPQVNTYTLPESAGQRALLIFTKKFQTPAVYPRRPGIPHSNPL